jgi:tRNA (Thr-GGU) A37 N-methylase
LVFGGLSTISCGLFDKVGHATARAENANETKSERCFRLYQVGEVERQGGPTSLQIYESYSDALKGLDGFSHVLVLYWFDRNDTPEKRKILQVHPRGNKKNPLTGVFACRAP